MKLSCSLGAACCAVFLLAACAPAPKAPDTAAMIAAAEKLDKEFMAAFNAGDAEAMSKMYWNSPEVVSFMPGKMMAKGVAEIKTDAANDFNAMKGAKLEITEQHHVPVSDVVMSWGLWKMTIPTPDGKAMEMTGRYSDVKAERDGKWVYLMDHASVPLPPPPAPPAKK
jgi:uncharacterized protein (TIGR02246 family)